MVLSIQRGRLDGLGLFCLQLLVRERHFVQFRLQFRFRLLQDGALGPEFGEFIVIVIQLELELKRPIAGLLLQVLDVPLFRFTFLLEKICVGLDGIKFALETFFLVKEGDDVGLFQFRLDLGRCDFLP